MGESEVDTQFKVMSSYLGLCHFKKGVLFVMQWTGTEYKEMEKVFMGILVGAVNSKVLTVAWSLIDFIYYSQYQLHTSKTLKKLEKCLKIFHDNKQIFINLKIRKHFNVPKLHAIQHYVEGIQSLGSADGYNTESPEHLHIDFAKAAYRASNKCDYMEQMAIWLQHQEAIWIKTLYLMWVNQTLPTLLKRQGMDDVDVHEPEVDDDQELTAAVMVCDIPTILPISKSTSPIWQVTKTPPYTNMSPEQLATQFAAQDLISQLSVYLGSCLTFPPNLNDKFNAYHQVKLILPPNHYLSNQTRTNWIRTMPAVPRKGQQHVSLGHFDVALIIVDRNKYQASYGFDGRFHFINLGEAMLNKLYHRSLSCSSSCNLRPSTTIQLKTFRSTCVHRMVYTPWSPGFGNWHACHQM